jgi:hypothetical protein
MIKNINGFYKTATKSDPISTMTIFSRNTIFKSFIILGFALGACSKKISPMRGNGVSNKVNPIVWSDFNKGNPSDDLAVKERAILLNSNKYGLTTWYNEKMRYKLQNDRYLILGDQREKNIREAGSEALALAVSIRTGVYDGGQTGVSLTEAKEIALKLIRSVAYRHQVNTSGGWGNSWQSALWTGYASAAGWMMWDDLSIKDREYVRKMVEFEANRFNQYEVPYYKDKTGKVIFKGDSKSEENSWNAMTLHVALAMMPDHPNRKIWMDKNIELLLSASARPEDINSDKEFNGKKLKDILKGSNYNSDGTVTNHGIIHPDYMSCTAHTFFNALMFTLAERPTPQAAFFNTDLIYNAMVDLNFPNPKYVIPGGTIYVRNSDVIYYPQNTDWGRGRRMCYALMDCEMRAFGMDSLASKKGDYWEGLHAQAVLNMQKRDSDGRTYRALTEDNFGGREEWVAAHAAQAYLTKWLMHQGKFSKTNTSN